MKFKLIATEMILALTLSIANAQDPIRVGELNSYKAFPSALEPYKLGWRLAVEEINAKGGVLERRLRSSRGMIMVTLGTPCGWLKSWCRASMLRF